MAVVCRCGHKSVCHVLPGSVGGVCAGVLGCASKCGEFRSWYSRMVGFMLWASRRNS